MPSTDTMHWGCRSPAGEPDPELLHWAQPHQSSLLGALQPRCSALATTAASQATSPGTAHPHLDPRAGAVKRQCAASQARRSHPKEMATFIIKNYLKVELRKPSAIPALCPQLLGSASSRQGGCQQHQHHTCRQRLENTGLNNRSTLAEVSSNCLCSLH